MENFGPNFEPVSENFETAFVGLDVRFFGSILINEPGIDFIITRPEFEKFNEQAWLACMEKRRLTQIAVDIATIIMIDTRPKKIVVRVSADYHSCVAVKFACGYMYLLNGFAWVAHLDSTGFS